MAVNTSWTSATVAATGIVTVLPFVDGLNVYVVAPTRLEYEPAPCARPITWIVCVRVAQIVLESSLTAMLVMLALLPRLTVSVLGYVLGAPSQYVVTLLSFALAATNDCCTEDALIVFPSERFEDGGVVGVAVGRLVAVAVAVDVAVARVVAVAVAADVAVARAVGVGVAVAVLVEVAVGRAVAVGVAPAATNLT